jgi:hypothetical protein
VTLMINLGPKAEAELRARAAAAQKDVETFALEVLLESLGRQTLSATMLPLQQAFADSGITEAEADELIARARREYHD